MWCSKRHLRSLSWHRISVQRMSSWRVRSHPRPYWEFKDNYSWVLWREKGSLLLWKCSKHFLLAWSSCRSLKSWAMRGVMQPQFWIWVFLSETFLFVHWSVVIFGKKNTKYSLNIFRSIRSSYSENGLLYIYPQPLFLIFTQSIYAIDVTRVTLSCSKLLKQYHCNWCHKMLIDASWIFQCVFLFIGLYFQK